MRCLDALRETAANVPLLAVTRLVLNPQGKLVLVLVQGTRVYLGDPEDLTRKLWVVRNTVSEAQQQGYPLDNLAYIDARIIERVASVDNGERCQSRDQPGAVFKPRIELGQEGRRHESAGADH